MRGMFRGYGFRRRGFQPHGSSVQDERLCPKCGSAIPEASDTCPVCTNKGRLLFRIFRMLKPYWPAVLLVWLLLMIATGLNLVPPYLTKPLVDKTLAPGVGAVPAEQRLSLLAWLVAGLLVSRTLAVVVSVLRGRIIVRISNRISHDLRKEVFGKIQAHSIRFFDSHRTGDLMSRISNDTSGLERVIIEGVETIVVDLMIILGISAVLLVMNWRLAVLIMVPVPAVIIASRFVWKKLMTLFRRYWDERGKFGAAVNDTLSGIRVIKAFAREQGEIEKFNSASADLRNASAGAETASVSFMPVLAFAAGCGSFIIWYVGGRDVVAGRMTAGTLMAFLAYAAMLLGPLRQLTRAADWFARCLTSAHRVFEILDVPSDVPEPVNPRPMPCVNGCVEFRGVSFSYDKRKKALDNISFNVQPGEMIGIVGHSGAGKSTLINLLCRFYDPDSGSVLVDGVDAREIAQRDLRRGLGVVLQDTFLFNASIAENIAFSRPSASMGEITAAARTANAHDFIMGKPDSYNTIIGERGIFLSGGERQRIAIARAVLHDPRILILDEATSCVDADAERAIQQAIAKLVEGRTTFAIAHRLSTLRNATRLIVLKEGRIIETGAHDELLARKGEFYRLVQMHKEISAIDEVNYDLIEP